MSDRRIGEATPDTNIGGAEKIPMDDAGAAKFATTGQIKDYVLAQLAAIAAATDVNLNSDGIYLLKGGVVKPISAATLTGAILDFAFGLAAVSEPNGNEIIPIKDNGVKKTITFDGLKAWLEDNLSISADLDVSDLPAAPTPLEDADLLLVARGSANGRFSISNFKEYVLGKFADYVSALTAAQTIATTDVLYVINGGTARKCTVDQLRGTAAGDVKGPETTTENKVPQWDSTQKKLKDGLEIATSIAASPSGTKIPTEGAVRTAIDAVGNGFVKTTTDQAIAGTKTFSASPVVPTPTQNGHAVTKKYVDDFMANGTVLLESNQTIAGTKTFSSSPIVPNILDNNNQIDTEDSSQKSASTAWVTAKLSAWWTAIKAAAQTISGVWTFSSSPSVPAPTNDTDAANKKYITDNAVMMTGSQTIAGTKTFSESPVVPTVADATDNTTAAASTAFVQAAIHAALVENGVIEESQQE